MRQLPTSWHEAQSARGPVLSRIGAEGVKNYYAAMEAKRVVPKHHKAIYARFYGKFRSGGLPATIARQEAKKATMFHFNPQK